MEEGDKTEQDLIEELVVRCLEHTSELDLEAVTAVCAEHPDQLDRVRERLKSLERLGLLGNLRADDLKVPGHEILRRLGSGGMAVVYAAREDASGEVVALKTADPRLPWTDRMRERFRREIQAARRLDHPRIVRMRSVGEADGLPYYTMDYVEGATLADMIGHVRRERDPARLLKAEDLQGAWREQSGADIELGEAWGRTYVEVVCRIALEVAEALEHVHAHGIVHRDVKPSNVLVDADGHGNLFDLGIAHVADNTRLTQTGDFAGSPHYASPEQVHGSPGELDARADVYGLGATLFELLALRPPFEGKSTPELLRKILKQEAPGLRQFAPDVPVELEKVCRCCLEKDPTDRYANAGELAEDLRRFLGFLPVHGRPVGVTRRVVRFARRNPATALAASLVGLLLVTTPLALWVHNRSIAGERDRAERAALEARREADENREVSLFLESLFLRLDRDGDPARGEVALELIEEARARLEAQEGILPLTRAGLFHTVGRVLAGMGRELDAVPLFDRAYSIRAIEQGEDHPETAATVQELAALHLALGDRDSARALAERGLASEAGSEEPTRSKAAGKETLGRIARMEGDLPQAQSLLEEALAEFRVASTASVQDEARVLRGLGRLHLDRGDHEAARAVLARSLELESTAWEPNLADMAETQRLLAREAEDRGDTADAVAAWGRALHLHSMRGLAAGPESLAALERLVPLEEARLADGGSPPLLEKAFEHLVQLGESRSRATQPGAGAAFERALARAAELEQPNIDLLGRAHLGRGLVLWSAGLLGEARTELAAAEEARARAESVEAWVPELFEATIRLAREMQDEASLATALDLAGPWYLSRVGEGGAPYADLARALRQHALLLFELEQGARAEEFLRGADNLERRQSGAGSVGMGIEGAQDEVFAAAMQRAITYLQVHRPADAVPELELCCSLHPEDSVARYNLACALAGAGELDRAFDTLERAMELGYVYRERSIELTLTDPDLSRLREDPRFDLLLARMEALVAAAEAYSKTPAVHVPPGVDPASAPLLVVLHANGDTKQDVVAGPWRETANALGLVLLAPSGRIPAGTEPEQGMRWIDSLVRYSAKSWYFEKPARDALADHRRRYGANPGAVYVAGEGFGGTLAFNIAVHSPEEVQGCLLVDAAVPVDLAGELAPTVADLGLRVALIADPQWRPPGIPRGMTTPQHLAHTFRQLNDWGFEATLGTLQGRTPAGLTLRFIDAVRFLQTGRQGR